MRQHNPPSLPRSERARLEAADAPMPNGFTGRWRGVYFFKGQRWAGPTCAMRRPSTMFQEPTGGPWVVR